MWIPLFTNGKHQRGGCMWIPLFINDKHQWGGCIWIPLFTNGKQRGGCMWMRYEHFWAAQASSGSKSFGSES